MGADPLTVSDRFVTCLAERAVPAVRALRSLDLWAMETADPADLEVLLDGQEGCGATYWDEALILYQAHASPGLACLRAVPVDRDRVCNGLMAWSGRTIPPFVQDRELGDQYAFAAYGPHPSGNLTQILVSFATDPDAPGRVQAFGSVAWVDEA